MNRKLTSRSRSLLTIAGWLAATAAATSIGVLAVGAIGSGIAGTPARPLSAGEVTRALATANAEGPAPTASAPTDSPTDAPINAPADTPTARPSRSGTAPGSQPTGASRVLGSEGGTVVARCVAGKAELISWSPAQGYEAEDIRRGPAASAGLQFESNDDEIMVSVDCRAGVPIAHNQTDDRGRH